MAEQIAKVRDAFNFFETKLQAAVDALEQKNRVAIERLATLDGYNPKHPIGSYGLLFSGKNFTPNEKVRNQVTVLKEDMLIGVLTAIRFFENSKIPIANQPDMMPSDYTELLEDTIAGIEVENRRAEYDRKIVPVRTELIEEDRGLWKYLTTFSIPLDFIEAAYRT